jgi:LEA14-like dessication related protein
MKISTQHFIYLCLVVYLSGCAELAKHAETVKPTAELTGARLANISFDQVDLVFDLEVENKNPIELDLAGLDYDFKIEDQSLVSGVTAKAIKLKANGTSPVQLPVTLKFDDLKKLPGELWNKDKLAYDLQTTFNIMLPVIGNYAIPVSKQGELPVPKTPGIKLKGVKIKNLSFTSADLVAQVEVDNPNDFDMAVRDFNYQLNINQVQWGQGEISKSNNIPGKGKGVIEIPVKLNLLSIGSAASSLLKKGSPLEYQLTGNATLDTGLELLNGYNLPLDIKGTTSTR